MKKTLGAIFLSSVLLLAVSCGSTLKQKKEEGSIHYRLGAVHLNERNYTEALKELTLAVEKDPGDPNYHNALGLAYFYKKMNKEAISSMKRAIELNPKFSEAYVAISAVYLDERRWDDAIKSTQAALKNIFYSTPEYAHFNMGKAYFGKGDYQAAVESYKKAIEANPDYPVAYYSLGAAYEKTNSLKEAAAAYELAVKNFPEYVDAYYSLGVARVKLRNKPAAQQAFERVIAISPASDKAQSAREYINLLK